MTRSPTPTWKRCVLTPRANRRVRDTLALALVNLTSVCWLPGTGNRPQTVRSRADNRFHQSTQPTL